MSIKLLTQCPQQRVPLLNVSSLPSCRSCQLVYLELLFTSSLELNSAYFFLPLHLLMLSWDTRISLHPGPRREVLLRELRLGTAALLVWNTPCRQDAACTHFLMSLQWFCCFHGPALPQGPLLVGWGPMKGELGVRQHGERCYQ